MRNILVVDDHPFFLHGFSQYLGDTQGFEVDTALSVDEAIGKIDIARPDLAMGHLDASLGVVFVGLGGIVLQREPRDGLLLAMGLFLVHALINIAHRPGWLSTDVAPHWFTVGCAIYDVYLAGLCFWVWRR